MRKTGERPQRVLWTLILLSIPWNVVLAEWPQWGGPGRDFTAEASASLSALPANGPRLLWKQDLGPGFSAIVSDDERLITMYRRGDQDVIVCLSVETGKRLWEHSYDAPVPDDDRHLDTSYGEGPNSTPLLAEGRVYTLGFSGIVTAVNLKDGTPAWTHDLEAEYGVPVPYFGHAASPIHYKDMVIFVAGGAFAFDAETGAVRWKNRSFGASYASPLLIPRSEGPILVGAVAGELCALEPDRPLAHARALCGDFLPQCDDLFRPLDARATRAPFLQCAGTGRPSVRGSCRGTDRCAPSVSLRAAVRLREVEPWI